MDYVCDALFNDSSHSRVLLGGLREPLVGLRGVKWFEGAYNWAPIHLIAVVLPV